MTAIHHRVVGDAIVAELQAWLLAQLPAGATQPTVRYAWPDFQAERPAGDAFLVVTSGSPDTTAIAPVLHTTVQGEGADATHVWRVGVFVAAAQVDIFARTKQLGDELAHLVSRWFSMPPKSGVRAITVADYWNARFKIQGQSVSWGPDSSPLDGQWRQTFSIRVDGPVLSDSDGLTLLRLDVDISLGGDTTFTLE